MQVAEWMPVVCVLACILLYFLAIMPRVWGRPDQRSLKGWYYAHRGFYNNDKKAPENSMRAFERAVEKGYGIELDVQLTKDKKPVVFHDFTLKRVCKEDGKVSDYTYEQLKQFRLFQTDQRIPLLSEVLKLVGGRVPLIVELKIERTDLSVCPATAALLERYQGPYCIESFNPLGLFWFRWKYPRIVRGQLSDNFPRETGRNGIIEQCLRHLLFNWLTKPDFIAYHCKYPGALSRWLCRHLYGATAVAWTVRSSAEKKKLEKEFDLFIFEHFAA